jgi:hypothetical protein
MARLVAKPSVIGLRKGCPSLEHNRKDEEADRIFGLRTIRLLCAGAFPCRHSRKGVLQAHPSPHLHIGMRPVRCVVPSL